MIEYDEIDVKEQCYTNKKNIIEKIIRQQKQNRKQKKKVLCSSVLLPGFFAVHCFRIFICDDDKELNFFKLFKMTNSKKML